ncbi:peroxiredoxin-like family protein [Thiocystis violacea]|uniref:peroxiredoxin-like family protein n=1 Tax=Thiocystis violacea TaxID=13725 RepID=UPI0019059367|nr:peroxiredoxin-like family protein [Thiocystis violacea]
MRTLTMALSLLPLCPALALAEAAAPVPSYSADRDAYQASRATSPGPALTPADRAVMDQAARDLAAAMPDPGLHVGETAPDFTLPNAVGESVPLAALLRTGPVVLVFYRGAWCPYCNLQLHGLRQALPEIERQGARLVAITPQTPDRSRTQVEQDGYPFEILSDLDDRVMTAYRLAFEVPAALREVYRQRLSLDLADYNGAGRFVLPVPATFVIDRQGVVRFVAAEVDYRNRAEPSAILAALRALATD